MKEKTEWVIGHQSFGKRRIWKDDEGFYFVVNNIAYREVHEAGDDYDVYKSILVDTKR